VKELLLNYNVSTKPIIITHRGLEPESPRFTESSYEAFADHLSRGFGLEFDLQSTADGVIVISHDSDLSRITNGRDTRKIEDITSDDFLSIELNNGHTTTLSRLLNLIAEQQLEDVFSALHVKSTFQNKKDNLERLIREIKDSGISLQSFVLFDVTLGNATYLKEVLPGVQIAVSVSHPFDIERYNNSVGGTLYLLDTALQNSHLLTHVWLDEWDLVGTDGSRKSLYNEATFAKLRDKGLKICLVSPELHSSSPSLLGGESHEDASTLDRLINRVEDIISLEPDAVCTDYPNLVKDLLN
jgi:Glycerophosphoryl diester phosphodiesterase family